MPPLLTVGVALLLLSGSVLGLRECVDQAGPSCVSLSEAQCGHAHPRLSPTARLCLKSCGLCVEGPPPVCAQGYFDPGLDTCVPCSTRCHGADNCRRQLTCPQGCPPGRHGYRCQRRCPPGCPARCDRWSGLCTEGCRHGRHGDWCHKRCPPSCHSSWCSQATGRCRARRRQPAAIHRRAVRCSYYCRNGACDPVTDVCTEGCVDGRRGEKCTEYCPLRCRSPRRCEQTTGRCLDGCLYASYWGEDCSRDCPRGCSNRKCNQTTGRCLEGCQNPYKWGEDCSLQCPSGCSNAKCNQTTGACLDRRCNSTSGECTAGCRAGYRGSDCRSPCPNLCRTCAQYGQGCSPCQSGFYSAGDTCTRCPPNCQGVCDALTGACPRCLPGYFGRQCGETCSPSCRTEAGQPRPRCQMQGGACRDGCQTGKYGSHCQHNCSANCRHRDCQFKGQLPVCSQGCRDGFKGDYCQKKCPTPCLSCDVTRCVSCRAGLWGDKCTLSCTNCVGSNCSKNSGLCVDACVHGFHGDRCDRKCSSGCQAPPAGGALCNRTDGVCLHGCLPGWRGGNCTDPDAATGSGDPGFDRDLSEGRSIGRGVAMGVGVATGVGVAMGVGVATGVGGTVLLAALGWTLLRWRRRRRPGQDKASAGGVAIPLETPLRPEAPLPVSPGEGHYQSLEPATRDVSPPNPYAGLEETQPVPGASSSSQEGVYEIV